MNNMTHPFKRPMLKGNYFVYITTNPGRTVLYTGVTNDLEVRLRQHYENRGNKKTFAGRPTPVATTAIGCCTTSAFLT